MPTAPSPARRPVRARRAQPDVVDEDGAIARHKIVVVVDGTSSQGVGAPESVVVVPYSGGVSRSERGPTGSVVNGVGVLRVDVPA